MTKRTTSTIDKAALIAALRTVHDPELPVNIYDLGLIYDLTIDDATATVRIAMTLTAPNCPMAEQIVADVRSRITRTPGVNQTQVDLVWEPAWSADRMSQQARLALLALGVDPSRPGATSTGSTRLTVGRKRPSAK